MNERREIKMTTKERLDKLEMELAAMKRRNRRLLTIAVLTIGGLGLVWTLMEATPAAYAQEAEAVQKIVRANSFVVVDENDKERIVLDASPIKSILQMKDGDGKLCAVLMGSKKEAELGMFNEKGGGVVLSVDKDASQLNLSIESGKGEATLSADMDGSKLLMCDENRKGRTLLAANTGGPGLSLLDKKGVNRAMLVVLKDTPSLAMFDENGKTRAELATYKDGPRLDLSDEKGKSLWKAP
jgi:hypothetical protein